MKSSGNDITNYSKIYSLKEWLAEPPQEAQAIFDGVLERWGKRAVVMFGEHLAFPVNRIPATHLASCCGLNRQDDLKTLVSHPSHPELIPSGIRMKSMLQARQESKMGRLTRASNNQGLSRARLGVALLPLHQRPSNVNPGPITTATPPAPWHWESPGHCSSTKRSPRTR